MLAGTFCSSGQEPDFYPVKPVPFFDDSDLFKIMEGTAYSLATFPFQKSYLPRNGTVDLTLEPLQSQEK